MLIKTFMVILTLGSEGEIGGAFAAQTDMEACENKIPAIVHTIESSGSKIIESGCFQADWAFSEFSHREKKNGKNAYYFMDFSKPKQPTLMPMVDMKACDFTVAQMKLTKAQQAHENLYCVSSYQNWIVTKTVEDIKKK